MEKGGQGAVEFMILFGFFLLFFVFFLTLVRENIASGNERKEDALLRNVAVDVRDEIRLASEASSGYSRSFIVPEEIMGHDYTIFLQDDRVYVFLKNRSVSFSIPEVDGSLEKGENLIVNEGGSVHVNV